MNSQTRFPPVIIRASAGTGKTYQLAVRFIGLLAAGARPDEILATTFTRKAAGEILDRVMLWLAQAAADDVRRQELAEAIGDSGLNRARCRELLVETVRSLHRLRVGTLDSYFIQIAGSFALELGLPPGWKICEPLDDALLRDEAIELALARGRLADLLALVHSLTKGATARGVGRLVRDTVGGLFELYRDTGAPAWQQLPRHKELPIEELERTIDAIASFDLSSDKRMAGGRDEDVQRARAADWETLIDKGLAAKILCGECAYYKKPISPELMALYRVLLKQAEAVLVGQIARQTEATHDLLERFAEHYYALQHSQRMMRFSDITHRLAQTTTVAQPEQLAFRLDAGVKHVLLDEFQDTAPPQWRVLRPLAQAVMSRPGSSFFCVGDAKQAIYGWRGGVAEIFDALESELTGLTRQTLACSYRSAQPVIDAVNQVFQNLARHTHLDNLAEPVAAWQSRFPEHTTKKGHLAGHASLSTCSAAGDGQSQTDVLFEYAAERIAQAAKRAPEHSIGVLVRTNDAVAHLIYLLRDRHGILASEEGGNPLTDSPAVELILSLLRLADHPGHSVARFHLASSPLAIHLGLTNYRDTRAAVRISQQLRRQLLENGYGTTIQAWAHQLAGSCDRRDLSRLQQLVELAYDYQPASALRADRFVALVESERIADPMAANVRVMTIHQAKGLQFDVVCLPELDGKLCGQPEQFVAGRPGPTQPVDLVCRLANKNVRQFFPPHVAKLFEDDIAREVTESLCVLYVAMTRAVHALHMIATPAKASEKSLPKTFAGILRATLAADKPATPSAMLYEHGDSAWSNSKSATARRAGAPSEVEQQAKSANSLDSPATSIKLAPPLQRRERGLERTSPSHLEGGPKLSVSQLLEPTSAAAFEYGTLVHAWLEQIVWLDDRLPGDAALAQVALRLAPKLGHLASDVTRPLAEFHRQLAAPAVAAALSRAFYDDPMRLGLPREQKPLWKSGQVELEVQRERPFAVRIDDQLVTGSIDRLVVIKNGGKPVAADVIDFKTDDIATDDAVALSKKVNLYRPQIDAYRRAVAQMLLLAPERVSARLVFLKVDRVEAVGID